MGEDEFHVGAARRGAGEKEIGDDALDRKKAALNDNLNLYRIAHHSEATVDSSEVAINGAGACYLS
jgi:hypothetical protein